MQVFEAFHERRVGRIDPPARIGHTCMLGKSGYGKGTTGQTLMEHYYQEGTKVLIWTQTRSEMTTMSFKEDNKEMCKILYSRGLKPRAFPTEVLTPVFNREGAPNTIVKIPSSWTPCKIRYTDLTKKELLFLVGATSEKAEQIINALPIEKFKTLAQLQLKVNQLASGTDALLLTNADHSQVVDIGNPIIYGTISRAIGSLIKKNIVASNLPEGFEFIDIEKIQKDNKKITVIAGNASWSDENFMMIFINVMQRIIYFRHLFGGAGKIPRLAVYIPEISNFEVAGKILQVLLQEARDAGIEVVIDTQRPQNITRPVAAQITRWYVFNMNPDDRNYFHSNLKDLPMDYNIHDSVPDLERGICVLLYSDNGFQWQYRKACMVNPPQSHKKVAYEDIVDYFQEKGVVPKIINDVSVEEIGVTFLTDIPKGVEIKTLSKALQKKLDMVSPKEKIEQPEEYNESQRQLIEKFGDGLWHDREELLQLPFNPKWLDQLLLKMANKRVNRKDRRKSQFKLKVVPPLKDAGIINQYLNNSNNIVLLEKIEKSKEGT